MNWSELIEALVIIGCGIVLISPEFNTLFAIPIISLISDVPDEIISHLALGLLPIIALSIVGVFKN